MPKKNRTFEANASTVQSLDLKARSAQGDDLDLEARLLEVPGGVRLARRRFPFSREIILRLINYLKEI